MSAASPTPAPLAPSSFAAAALALLPAIYVRIKRGTTTLFTECHATDTILQVKSRAAHALGRPVSDIRLYATTKSTVDGQVKYVQGQVLEDAWKVGQCQLHEGDVLACVLWIPGETADQGKWEEVSIQLPSLNVTLTEATPVQAPATTLATNTTAQEQPTQSV